MIYHLKAGVLYVADESKPLAHIRSSLCGAEKQVLAQDGSLLLRTDIRSLCTDPRSAGDVRCKEYVMYGADGTERAAARPRYSGGDDPSTAGWPICRMPRADRATLSMDGQDYTLVMENVQNYALTDARDRCAVRIIHQGMSGGWKVECTPALSPEVLCGLFIFCRYLEKENEFMVV